MTDHDFGFWNIKKEPKDRGYGDEKLTPTKVHGHAPIKQEPLELPFRNKDAPPDRNLCTDEVEVKPRRTSRKTNNVLVSRDNNNNDSFGIARENLELRMHTLDEIASMDGKQLVHTFSELSSNEMTKYYAYTCCLMPDVCSNFFTSFGSENDARNRMQKHLLQHVKELLATKQKDKTFSFTAEGVVNSLTEVEAPEKQRGRPRQPFKGPKKIAKSCMDIAPDTPTTKQSPQETQYADVPYFDIASIETKPPDYDQPLDLRTVFRSHDSNSECHSRQHENVVYFEESDMSDVGYSVEVAHFEEIVSYADDDEEGTLHIADETSAQVEERSAEGSSWRFRNKKSDSSADDEERKFYMKSVKRDRKGKALVKYENAALSDSGPNSYNVDDLTADLDNVWLLDHSYDVRHRNCSGGESEVLDDLDDEIHYYEKPSSLPSTTCKTEEGRATTNLPDLSHLLNESFQEDNSDAEEHPAKRHKSCKVKVEPHNSTEDEEHPNNNKPCEPIRLASEDEIKEIESMRGRWTKEHEKILAKYYLTEHEENKGRNRKQGGPWICKICPDKQFTAGTTLSYHYKSHTGEKAYQCRDCLKTFTRKHSLDYHSMTHTKTNRFKCPFCDRQFRHTSHYKSHVEQHKGEETFQCTVCNMSFKSKTTFKRHMKSKHNAKLSQGNKASRVMDLSTINELHLKSATTNSDLNSEEDVKDENVDESVNAMTEVVSDDKESMDSSVVTSEVIDSQSEILNGQKEPDHPSEMTVDHGSYFPLKPEPLDDPFYGVHSNHVILIQPLDEEEPAPVRKQKANISWRPLPKKQRRK